MATRLRLATVSAMVMTLFVASLSSYITPEAFAQTSGSNTPPVLDLIGPQRGDEGTLITFTATATDPDIPADTLEFTMNNSTGSGVPSSATLDPQSGVFEWTPTEKDGGTTHTFPVIVSDGTTFDSQLVTVTVDDTNTAPVLNIPAIEDSYPEQMRIRLAFAHTDSDHPQDGPHTYELTGADSNLVDSFGANSGVLVWTPSEDEAGTYSFTVTVHDHYAGNPLTDSRTFDLVIREPNVAPVLNPIGPQRGDAGTLITFTATATDEDVPSNPLTFSLADGAAGSIPSGAAIDQISGVFAWTPQESQAGAHTFDVTVTDGAGGSDSETVTVTVTTAVTGASDDNTAPVLDPIGPQRGDEGTLITFTATATDADTPPDTLEFTMNNSTGSGVPSSATLDPQSGVFEWTPTEKDGGTTHTFPVIVSDGTTFDSQLVTVTVDDTNTAPVLNIPAIEDSYPEQMRIRLAFTHTDSDHPIDGPFTYELTGADSNLVDSFGANSGVLVWTPSEDEAGTYSFTVTVHDHYAGNPLTDSRTFDLVIREPNVTPVLNPIGPQRGDAGSTITFTATATDEDVPSNPLTFSLADGAAGSVPSGAAIDQISGVFAWTPQESQAGAHTFDVTVTDGAGGSDSETVTVTVTTAVTGASDDNTAPVLDPIGPQRGDEGTLITFTATATDADIPANTLEFTMNNSTGSGVPSAATLDPQSGVFEWTPTEKDGGTTHTFPVIVSDGTTFDSQLVTVTVDDTNTAPVLNIPAIADSYPALAEIRLAFTHTDSDHPTDGPHTYELTGANSNLVDSFRNGVLVWTPSEDDDGTYSFTVTVSDNHAENPLSDSRTFDLVIGEQNSPPVLNPIGSQPGNVGTPTIFTATATDADTPPDTLRFSLTDGAAGSVPDGAAIDPVSGLFEWTPNASQIAVHTFDVTVSDGTDSVSETITIVVISTGSNNVPLLVIPTIASFYPQGVQFELDFDVTDADSDQSHTFALTGTGSNLVDSFDAATGILVWTPDETEHGAYRFTVSVTDDHAEDPLSTFRTFDLIILERNFAVGASSSASAKEKSGESREYLKAPTFGKSRLNNNQVVECGYSMDGQCTDVLSYHEEYKRQVIQTNSTHDFTLKAFGQSPIKQFQIGFGVSGIGEPINNAEAVIKIITTQDNKSVYSVDSVEIIDNDNTIDFDPQNASVQKVSCTDDDKNGDKTPQCVELALNGVLFREQFHSEPFVIHVMDNNRRSSHNYMNEGLLIQGPSLNPAHTASKLGMPFGTSDLVNFELTRTDKLADIWTDQFGHIWTKNSFGTWLQLTFPEIQHNDGDAKPVSVMTRVNSDFADLVMEEQDRATLIFDAANIVNQTPETFSHDYSGSDHELTRTQNLAEQIKVEQERAQKILDSIK